MRIRHGADEALRDLQEMADDYLALLRHVMCLDDEPPQGLHRGGWKQTDEEEEWWWDYRYPPFGDDA